MAGMVSTVSTIGIPTSFSTFFPLMLAVALVLPGPDLAIARLVSILMGALLVFPCAVIARRLSVKRRRDEAPASSLLYPLLADISAAAITDRPSLFW